MMCSALAGCRSRPSAKSKPSQGGGASRQSPSSLRRVLSRLSHLWLDAAYRGEEEGKGWVEKVLGWTVELVERPRSLCPKRGPEVVGFKRWLKEGVKVDWEKRLPPKGFQVLPRSGGGTHVFLDRPQQEDMSKDYERLTETSEAFIYVAMSRLMTRRWARP
jgi:putative transposase